MATRVWISWTDFQDLYRVIMKEFICCAVLLFLCVSCTVKEKFTEQDLSIIPYNGHERLVYQSDRGDSNVIQLTGYKTLYFRNKKYDSKGKKYYQVQRVLSRELLQNGNCSQEVDVPPACYFIILAGIKDGLFLQVSFNDSFRGVFEADMSKSLNYS